MKQILKPWGAAALFAALVSPAFGDGAPPPATLDPSFATSCQASGPGTISALALRPDGQILVGGWFTSFGGVARTNVARLNADGSVDPAFVAGPQYPSQPIDRLALQTDGKLWVGGGFTNIAGHVYRRLARLQTNGSVDLTVAADSGVNSNIKGLAIQTNGQVVLAGYFSGVYAGGVLTSRPRVARLNANGALDDSFNAGTNTDQNIEAMVLQPDQKILIAGGFKNYWGTSRPPILRLNSDGTPAAGFTPPTALGHRISQLALQADGRILIAGTFTNLNGTPVTNFARLNADGSLDPTFLPRLAKGDEIRAFAFQADGKILIGGNIQSVNGTSCANLARLNPDGSVDTDFVFALESGIPGTVLALAVQPDGKILVACGNRLLRLLGDGGGGPTILTSPKSVTVEPSAAVAFSVRAAGEAPLHYQWEKDGVPLVGETNPLLNLHDIQPGDAGAYRVVVSNQVGTTPSAVATLQIVSTQPLSTDGMLDPTFNPGTGTDDSVYALARQNDGRVILGGWFKNYNGTPRTNLVRVLADGSLDASFSPQLGSVGAVTALALQPDGKFVAAGSFTNVGSVLCNGIARFNTNGVLDTTFNPGTGANGDIQAVALQTNGQVLIGGAFTSVNGVARTHLARLNTNGSVDAAFHPVPDDEVRALAVQPDGRVLVGGAFWNIGSTYRPRIARLDSAGNVDTTFNAGSVQGGVFMPYVSSITVLTSGQLLMAGNFDQVGGVTRNWLARLNANGGVDANFNAALGSSAQVSAVAVLPDGRLMVGGTFWSIGGLSRNNLARLHADGSGDASFDPGAGPSGAVYALALQPDGRTLLAGGFTEVDGVPRRRVARLLGDQSAPVIVTQPVSRTAAVGDTVRFTLQAVGFAPLAYRWQKGNTPIVGATNPTLVRANLQTADAGSYSVLVSNSLGTVTSAVAVLTVRDLPQVTEQPQGQCFVAGADISLHVTATASTPMSYQWWRDRGWSSGPVTGATNTTLLLTNLQEESRCWVVVSCTHGAVTSAVAELVIPRAGGLDPTCNARTGVSDRVYALALQPDGRILVGGLFSSVSGMPRENLARLLTNGALDASFGLESGADGAVNALTVHADGAVLVGGQFAKLHGVAQSHFGRIHPDNCVGAGFNPGFSGAITAIALQDNGKVITGGLYSDIAGDYGRAGLARFTAEGELDSSFSPWLRMVNSLAFAPEGGFAAGGYAGQAQNQVAYVTRCDSEGDAWPGFSAPAIQGRSVGTIALQSDGKIILGGSFTNVGGRAITNLARLNTDGTVDASFPLLLRLGQDVCCVAVQADDRILVGGRFSSIGGMARQNFARLQADGRVDLDYQAHVNERVCAIALQPDGHAVIGGDFTEVNGEPRGGVARLFCDAASAFTHSLALDRGLQLTLHGLPGAVYLVQTSTNLTTWSDWTNVVCRSGIVQFRDPSASGHPRRFYRARLPGASSPLLTMNGSLLLTLAGVPGATYAVQTSSNLVTWADWTNVICTNGTAQLRDPAAPGHAHRFYRARTP